MFSKRTVRLRVARIPTVSSMGGKLMLSSTVTPKKAGVPSMLVLTSMWSAASEPETNTLRPVSTQFSPAGVAFCWGARKNLPPAGSERALTKRSPARSLAAKKAASSGADIVTSACAAPMCMSQTVATAGWWEARMRTVCASVT